MLLLKSVLSPKCQKPFAHSEHWFSRVWGTIKLNPFFFFKGHFFTFWAKLGADNTPLRCDCYTLQEVVTARLVEALLQDLDPLLHIAQLLAVTLDLVLDVGQLAGRVHLQLFQHALLTLSQEAMKTFKRIPDGCTQALGWGLEKKDAKDDLLKNNVNLSHSHRL